MISEKERRGMNAYELLASAIEELKLALGHRSSFHEMDKHILEACLSLEQCARLDRSTELVYALDGVLVCVNPPPPSYSHRVTLDFDGVAVEFLVEIETDDDDDGCGSPSQTGNSMTGRRGSTRAVSAFRLANPAKFLADMYAFLNADGGLMGRIVEACDEEVGTR